MFSHSTALFSNFSRVLLQEVVSYLLSLMQGTSADADAEGEKDPTEADSWH